MSTNLSPLLPQTGEARLDLATLIALMKQTAEINPNRADQFHAIAKLLAGSAQAPETPPLCPKCGSPDRDLHPLTGRDDSEVRMCRDPWHGNTVAASSSDEQAEGWRP